MRPTKQGGSEYQTFYSASRVTNGDQGSIASLAASPRPWGSPRLVVGDVLNPFARLSFLTDAGPASLPVTRRAQHMAGFSVCHHESFRQTVIAKTLLTSWLRCPRCGRRFDGAIKFTTPPGSTTKMATGTTTTPTRVSVRF